MLAPRASMGGILSVESVFEDESGTVMVEDEHDLDWVSIEYSLALWQLIAMHLGASFNTQ